MKVDTWHVTMDHGYCGWMIGIKTSYRHLAGMKYPEDALMLAIL